MEVGLWVGLWISEWRYEWYLFGQKVGMSEVGCVVHGKVKQEV